MWEDWSIHKTTIKNKIKICDKNLYADNYCMKTNLHMIILILPIL